MLKTIIKKLKQQILKDAYQQADDIIKSAEIEAERKVQESQLLKAIKKEADKIKENTLKECNALKSSNLSIASIYKYSKVRYIGLDLWAVVDKDINKAGIINLNNTYVIPCIYDDIIGILDGSDDILVANYVKNSCLYGLVDRLGQIVIEPKYQEFNFGFKEKLWAVKLDNKWGYINRKGNIVISFLYDKAECFSNNKAMVELNGEEYYINRYGERIKNKNSVNI